MTTFSHAITRLPGHDMADGLTTSGLGAPDHALALEQHARYVYELEQAGLSVTVLQPLAGFPDAHFVEDAGVVTPEVAVLARSGAEERRGEADFMEPVLAEYRPTARIQEPGTLDGGDVLVIGRQVFLGLSERTNGEGARQLEEILGPHGYCVMTISVDAGLHFKSSVNAVTDDVLIATEAFSRHDAFAPYRVIVVDDGDEYSANVLAINDGILAPSGFPRTVAKLGALGVSVREIDVSEMRKMDGGLTCMALRF